MRGKEGSTYLTIAIAVFLMLALLAPVCHSADEGEETTGFPAGWSEDIRLTYTDIICRDPDVAVSGDCVYVVWRDSRSGSHEVYFKKSEDGGVSWSQDVKISNSSLVVEGPHLEVNGNHIHVVWGQYDMRREVHYRNSTDGGETWNLDVRLSKLDNSPSMTPVFTVDGNNIHVIWTEEPNFCGLQYIYYRNSTNGGNSWNSIQNITDYGYDWGTCIAANGLYVHVMHVRWVPNEMFYIRSTDGGITWEPEQQLSPIDVRDSWQNSIAVWQDNVHLVFGDTIDGSNEVHYMNSTDNGMTWETHPGKRISDIPDWSFLADMAIDENTINVVWGDSRDLYGTVGMPFEIYLTNSTDGGITWSLNVRLTFAENSSANPSIAMVNGKIHVVWVDNRDLGRTDAGEIYYKRYPEFPTDTIGPSIYHNPVVTANGRLPIPIYANITDDGWGGVDEVTLFYKNIGDLEYSNTSMGLYDRTPWNGTWNGEIPKQNKAGLLNYYILAADHSGNSNQTIEYQIDVYDWPWPNVTAISPVDGANNVGIVAPITLTFSEPMNISSVEESFSYTNGTTAWTSSDGAWNWDALNTTGTFTPTELLQYDTKYMIRINGSIAREADGHRLDGNEDSEWSPPETWERVKDMPGYGKSCFGSAVLNGKMYAVGGFVDHGDPPITSVEVYDPVNDSWATVCPMSKARRYHAVGVCQGKIYVIGGKDEIGFYIPEIEEYDPIADKWTKRAALQNPRLGHSVAVVDDKIYVIGGSNGTTLSSVEVYDHTLNITYEETNLSFPRIYSASTAYSSKIYVVGGSGLGSYLTTVEIYDPISKEWDTLSNMSVERGGLCLNVLHDHLYAMGGRDSTYNPTQINERYNPFTDKWTNVSSMPTAKEYFGAGTINGKIYTYGGLQGSGSSEINEVYIPYDDFYSSFTTAGSKKFNLTLSQGWNLVSLPLIQSDESIDEVLESIDGKWDCVQYYDSTDPDHWKSHNIYRPDSLNDLHYLDHRMGFWINITEPNVNLTVRGYIPSSTSINLYAGWNLVGYPSLNTETVANALWGTGADKVMVCNTSEPYNIKEVGPNYVMKPGEGYWVHVPADSVWVVDW